jgi:3-oxoacyl-[acyl-carrier protein] reductase
VKGTVVITGATKGLGREIVLAFGRAGWFVFGIYSSDEMAAENLRTEMTKEDFRGTLIRHDVTTVSDSIWNHSEILNTTDLVLVHNAAASFCPTPMHQLQWPDFETAIDVAVKGSWQCVQALIRPMLKAGRGAIVNVLTSAIESFPPKGFAAYVTAKSALRGLNFALAAEYGPRGVKVFTVSPGFMETALTKAWDERFREVIRGASRNTDPVAAAGRLLELVENHAIPGRGEDYQL